MEAAKQMFVITAGDSAAIVPTAERAGKTVETWLATGQERLQIVMRPAEQCAAIMGLPVQKEKLVRAAHPTKKAGPKKSSKPAAVKQKSETKAVKHETSKALNGTRAAVLDAIRGGADTLKKISKAVKKGENTCGYHVVLLEEAGLVVKTGRGIDMVIKPAAAKEGSIYCTAKMRNIAADACAFDASSTYCAGCKYRPLS